MGTETWLFEKELLKEQRDTLYKEYNLAIQEIQRLPRLDIHDKMDVLGVLANHLDKVIKQYPKIKEINID